MFRTMISRGFQAVSTQFHRKLVQEIDLSLASLFLPESSRRPTLTLYCVIRLAVAGQDVTHTFWPYVLTLTHTGVRWRFVISLALLPVYLFPSLIAH